MTVFDFTCYNSSISCSLNHETLSPSDLLGNTCVCIVFLHIQLSLIYDTFAFDSCQKMFHQNLSKLVLNCWWVLFWNWFIVGSMWKGLWDAFEPFWLHNKTSSSEGIWESKKRCLLIVILKTTTSSRTSLNDVSHPIIDATFGLIMGCALVCRMSW